jgi:hypothetical protein
MRSLGHLRQTAVPLFCAALVACSSSGGPSRVAGGDAAAGSVPDADTNVDATAASPEAGSPEGAADDAGAAADGAPVVVTSCTAPDGGALPVGVWQSVTAPGINLAADAGRLGTLEIEVDPHDPSTVYSTADHQGLFRSSDCGGTWSKINTGRNGPTLDTGSEWILRIDPTDTSIMYSSPLYGTDLSLFKSTNGGVDWDSVMPPGGNVAKALQYMFFQDLSIDPTDHLHLVVTFHVDCVAPYSALCMAESKDGGGTWRVFNGPPQLTGWTEDAGPVVLNETTFFFGAPFAGLFRTTDSGATWTQVAPQGYHRFYASSAGWTYMGSAQNGIYRSRDPASSDPSLSAWTVIPNTLTTVGGALIGDGQRIFAAARSYEQDGTTQESDGLTWTPFTPASLSYGSTWFNYDPVHHALYSTNTNAGLWRYITH